MSVQLDAAIRVARWQVRVKGDTVREDGTARTFESTKHAHRYRNERVAILALSHIGDPAQRWVDSDRIAAPPQIVPVRQLILVAIRHEERAAKLQARQQLRAMRWRQSLKTRAQTRRGGN